jgi:ribosome-associated translation inhibitor RaiA
VAWQNLIETNIKKLQHVAAIASARVILERERRGKGLFRLFAILEVPGPDFHAEAADYTVQAALRKVVHNLRRQIQSRKDRQLDRRKNHAQGSVLSQALSAIVPMRSAGRRGFA